MSITIKHLDGPLKGKTQEFGDDYGTILVGRSTEAEIGYPEESSSVGSEHLTINRDDSDSYTVELGGSEAEIDGKPAEDGAALTSGSVVTLGAGGPSFEVLLPGLTVKHLEGPLAGQRQYFPDKVAKIIFGRSREESQVIYPPDCKSVGRKHFALNRSPAGDYHVELFGKRYVAMDGRPVIDGTAVDPSSVIRLGALDGPSFKADMAIAAGEYEATAEQPDMPDPGGLLDWLGKRSRQLTAGGGVLALLFVGIVGWLVYENEQYKWVKAHTLQGVYLVVEKRPVDDVALATAFLIGEGLFATNAHVTEAMRGKLQAYYLLGPKGDRIDIKDVESHPGYNAFRAKALSYAKSGSTPINAFKSMPLPSAYDVGIIRVDPAAPLSEPLEVDATPSLTTGDALVTAGFPSEKIRAADNMTKGLAVATLRPGTVESLKDIFFHKTSEDAENLLLVQHGIPSTGGMSGSPLVDAWTGKVVAIISGGNTRALPGTDRVTDPAQVNFAQRADMLADLIEGKAQASLVRDQAYWNAAGASFTRYFDLALKSLTKHEESARGKGEEIGIVQGLLVPGEKISSPWEPAMGDQARAVPADDLLFRQEKSLKTGADTYSFDAEPGYEYRFIVDTIDALPARLDSRFAPAIDLKLKQADSFAAQLKAVDSESELPLSLIVAVTAPARLEIVVGGLLRAPVRYTLYAYRWKLPAAVAGESVPEAMPEVQQGTEAASTSPQQ